MGEIKDIVELCIKLRDEVSDRKVTAVVERMQSLLLSFQSAQIEIVEKHAAVLAENLSLSHKVVALESEIASLKAQYAARPKRRFQDGYTFHRSNGLWVEAGVSSAPFLCSKCFSDEVISPVQDEAYGWKCRTCGEYYADPQRPEPEPPRPPSMFNGFTT